MLFKRLLAYLSIRNKLLLLNIMICLGFFVIAGVALFSLTVVRDMATEVTNKDVGRIVSNSRTARDLSRLFAGIDLLSITFYGRGDNLGAEGNRLVGIIKDIAETTAVGSDLKKPFLALTDRLESFLSQCAVVNTVLHTRESIDLQTHADLTKLEDIISKLLIKFTLEGKDTSFVEQLLALSSGYRESLLLIGKLCAQMGPAYYFNPNEGKISLVIPAIDDFVLRLHTLTASGPEVSKYGKQILIDLQKYRETIIAFHSEMDTFNSRIKDLNHYKTLAMSAMENIDNGIYETTRLVSDSIKKIIFSTGAVVLLLSMFVIVALVFATAYLIRSTINIPMRSIQKGIESFSKGNFDTKIELDRIDEWGLIEKTLNNMATELLTSYTALKESEKKYRRIVENALVGFYQVEKKGAFITANQKMAEMFGYDSPENLISSVDSIANLYVRPEERQAILRDIDEKGFVHGKDVGFRRKDGKKVWVKFHTRVLREKGKTSYEGVMEDITEHKQAEEALEESEKKHRSILDAMIDSVYICSSDFRIIYMNPSMIKMMGHDATDEICHKALFDRDEQCPKCFHATVQQGERAETEITNPKNNRSYNVIHSPIFHQDGSISKMTLFRDITATKQLQYRLIRSERLSATGRLAATIAHEINSPLQGITSLLYSIKRAHNHDDELLEELNLLKSAFISIRDTVKKLLDLNRPGKEDKQSINLNGIIENTVGLLKSYLKKNNVKTMLNLSSRIPNITASPQQLGQVFMNLISNAVEAMDGISKPKDGLKTRETTGAKVTINSDLKEDTVVIEVADTGPGISKEDVEHIFDPFYTRKKEMGMGIGLSLCHGIIEDHHGTIAAKNAPEGGAVFTITLPIK